MKETLLPLVALFCLSGCGGSSPTAPSTPAPAPSRGIFADVTDPIGDAQARPLAGVTFPSDLVGATLEAKDGALTATISFATGTMSQANTRWAIYLDLDQDQATGAHNGEAALDPVVNGYEYIISFGSGSPPGSTPQARVLRMRFDANVRRWFSDSVGTAEVTFPTGDQSRTVIPLTLLGGDDGRLAFRINAQQWGISTSGSLNLQPSIDWLPNPELPSAATR